MTRAIRAAGALLLVVALGACGSDSHTSSGGRTVEVSITDKGCDPFDLSLPSGSTTFHVKNNGAESISEFEVLDSGNKIIGEKENLTPGLEGRFTIDLSPGNYTLACPGGTDHPTGRLVVLAAGASGSQSAHGDDAHGSDAAAACVPSGSTDAPNAHVAAALTDFQISLASPSIANGNIAIDATNNGTHPHEIVVVKGVKSSDMPVAADGTVDEDKLPAGAVVGELEAFNPGKSCSATLALTPGTYTLFCNVRGEEGAHFTLGMVTSLTVS